MKYFSTILVIIFLGMIAASASVALGDERKAHLGPRPFYLVDDLKAGDLKNKLQSCSNQTFYASDFSIGHRGASLQFPEHTRQSYLAAARMGAGILECDVTFTKDRRLVCRHSQCDLHSSTDILLHPELAMKCTEKFTPADPKTGRKASAKCCASDITLEEFKTLKGKMDAVNPNALTVAEYLDATSKFRTDLYTQNGDLLTLRESIELFRALNVKHTPELKSPIAKMPYQGEYTQEMYAQDLVDEYKEANVDPANVYLQSFNLSDVLYWIKNNPKFGRQAVFLVADFEHIDKDVANAEKYFRELAAKGVRIIAPALWMLVDKDSKGEIIPSEYSKAINAAGLKIITWSLERSGPLAKGGGWYYKSIKEVTDRDSVALELLHVLAQQVGVIGVFSDWPATTTFYANCVGLK